jgi:hypothetical protein
MSKLTDAAIEDNIGRAVACLKAARMTLHAGAKSPQQARKNRRLADIEVAICDAIKLALYGGAEDVEA